MTLSLEGDFALTPYQTEDRAALVHYLNEPLIAACTLRIPQPYTLRHADEWIDRVQRAHRADGRHRIWAIRAPDDELIGSIGFHYKYTEDTFKDEMGYWLAAPYRNRGLMTQAVRRACRAGFAYLGLQRIEAPVFVGNHASAAVLRKAGFCLEGTLRNYYRKAGTLRDAWLFARLPDQEAHRS